MHLAGANEARLSLWLNTTPCEVEVKLHVFLRSAGGRIDITTAGIVTPSVGVIRRSSCNCSRTVDTNRIIKDKVFPLN